MQAKKGDGSTVQQAPCTQLTKLKGVNLILINITSRKMLSLEKAQKLMGLQT